MIKGFLDSLFCMVSQTRHERRWRASIKLSKWELENRARKARFEELYPDYQLLLNPLMAVASRTLDRTEVEHHRRVEEWWSYWLDESHRHGREFPFLLVMADRFAPEMYVAPIGSPMTLNSILLSHQTLKSQRSQSIVPD